MLEHIQGKLTKRAPAVGIKSDEKLLYISYPSYFMPNITNENKKYSPPLPAKTALDTFKQQLFGWGFTLEILKDWTLVIDARDEMFCPHRQIKSELEYLNSIFFKITILSNSIHSTEDLEYDYHFYPAACVNIYNWYDHLQSQQIDWAEIDIDKHFIVLTRRPTKKRVLFVKSCLNLFSNNIVASCGTRSSSEEVVRMQLVRVDLNNVKKVDDKPKKVLDARSQANNKHFKNLFYPYPYPMTIDGLVRTEESVVTTKDIFFKSAVNVICESLENDDDPVNISEKTFKAFAWYQIPIWHASPGTVDVVRNMGFDLFDDIIDHSYDKISTYDERKKFILSQLESFYNKYPNKKTLIDLRKGLFDRLEENNRMLCKLVEKEKPYSPHLDWPNKMFK